MWAAAFAEAHASFGRGFVVVNQADEALEVYREHANWTMADPLPRDSDLAEEDLSPQLLRRAAKAVRKLGELMPDPPGPYECGDQSKLYYEHLAQELEKWASAES